MTATACEATGQSVDHVDQFQASTSGKPLRLAISGNDPGRLEDVLVSSVKETLAPIRQVECSCFPLAEELFKALPCASFDLLIVFLNPNWNILKPHDAQQDRELLRKLRSRSSAPLVVIHNGFAGHEEESLRDLGVDLVLPMPFEIATLQEFLSTRFKLASQDSQSKPVQGRPPPTDTCEPLLGAATKDLFRKNAFRVTGLPVDATPREIAKHADKLKVLAELDQLGQAQSAALPLKPAPTLDEIREAIQKLKEPEKRLIDEFFWFWPEKFGESRSDTAIQALAKGDLNAAIEIWRSKEKSQTDGVVATHNLALVFHVLALDWENYSFEKELSEERRQKVVDLWGRAFRRWQRVATSEQLWENVVVRIRQLNESNLRTGFARQMRATLPAALDKINAELAVAFAESDKMELARIHVQLMRDRNRDSSSRIEETAELVLVHARNRLKEQIRRAKERADGNPHDAVNAARELVEHARDSSVLFDLFFGRDSDFRNDVFDEVGSQCNRLSVAYQKATGDDKASGEILKAILPFATSMELRQQIEENISIFTQNIEMVRKNDLLYGALTPISSAPSLRTANGCGFMLYGSTDVDAATASFLTTYYFVLLGIPVFPICRYRVTRNGNSYRFFGKARLRSFDKWHLATSIGIILSLIISVVAFNSQSAPSTTSTYTAPSAYGTSGNSGGTLYRVPSSVGSTLDQEKAAIESERAMLETSEAQIDRLGREIEEERLYLDQTNPYIVQEFNAKVGRYNALVQQDKAAMAAFNAKVDSYNAKLRQYGR